MRKKKYSEKTKLFWWTDAFYKNYCCAFIYVHLNIEMAIKLCDSNHVINLLSADFDIYSVYSKYSSTRVGDLWFCRQSERLFTHTEKCQVLRHYHWHNLSFFLLFFNIYSHMEFTDEIIFQYFLKNRNFFNSLIEMFFKLNYTIFFSQIHLNLFFFY